MRRFETTVESLLEYIAENDMQLGAALAPERELAAAIGVSRNVLRQAFSILEERGLIYTKQGSGRYLREVPEAALGASSGRSVEQLEVASIADILEVRALLDVEAATLACQRRTLEEAHHLQELAGKLDTWADNLRFHCAIAAATHNFMLERLVREQGTVLGELNQREYYDDDHRRILANEHRQIADAVMSRDESQARVLARRHVTHTRRAIIGTKSHPEPESETMSQA